MQAVASGRSDGWTIRKCRNSTLPLDTDCGTGCAPLRRMGPTEAGLTERRANLGFARISGTPVAGDIASYSGKNVWRQALRFANVQPTMIPKQHPKLSSIMRLQVCAVLLGSDLEFYDYLVVTQMKTSRGAERIYLTLLLSALRLRFISCSTVILNDACTMFVRGA
jgi:hypothetical protein